jgi:hypothetical protein
MKEEEPRHSKPLCYILSEVGSDLMDDTASEPSSALTKSEAHYQSNRFRRLRSTFQNCRRGQLECEQDKDSNTSTSGREQSTRDYDEGDIIHGRDQTSFRISTDSAFTPVGLFRRCESSFPSQARLNESEDSSFYSSFSQVKQSSFGGEGRQDSKNALLQVSVEHECAQLMVPSFDHQETQVRLVLGVSFPHPAATPTLENGSPRLGVCTGHPRWIEREKDNSIWECVDSDPLDEGLDEELISPPSPIVVETTKAEKWDSKCTFPSSNDQALEEQTWETKVSHSSNDQALEEQTWGTEGSHSSNDQALEKQTWETKVSHSSSDQTPEDQKSETKACDSSIDQAAEELPWGTEDSTFPNLWNKSVYRPICRLAKEITACGQLADVSWFEKAPFDEIAIDLESIPFDEVAEDRQRKASKPHFTMRPQPSDSSFFSNSIIDIESSSEADWLSYVYPS